MTKSIVVFTRAIPFHQAGGMETVAWDLAVEWARRDYAVRVVTTAAAGRHDPFVQDSVEVVPLAGTNPGRYSRRWWSAAATYWNTLEAPPAVVLSVSAGAYSVVRRRSRHPKTRFVMQAHGTSVMEIGSKLRAREVRSFATAPKNGIALGRDLVRYRRFDRIVAVGDRVAESLRAWPQRWAVRPDVVSVIHNGVRSDLHAFDPLVRKAVRAELGISDTCTVVACVGRLHVQKRLDRALRAVAQWRDARHADPPHLLLVGDGPDEGRLRDIARDLFITDIVHFVGRVDSERVAAYYAAADVGLLTTSRREVGLPLAVLEALSCGLPCVVPREFAAQALDRALYQVDPEDAGQVAAVLASARRSEPRVSLLPREFTIDHCAERYLDLFQTLAADVGS